MKLTLPNVALVAVTLFVILLGPYLPADTVALSLSGLGALALYFMNSQREAQKDREANEHRAEMDRKASEREAEKQRAAKELELQMDVYFGATEALANAQTFIGYFCRADLSHEDHLSLIRDYSGKTSKVHLIGNLRVIQALSEFDAEIIATVVVLRPMRNAMMRKRSALTYRERELDWCIRSLEDLYKHPSSAPKADTDILEKHKANLVKQCLALEIEVDAASNEIALRARDHQARLAHFAAAAVVEVRTETKFSIDTTAYKRVMEEGVTKKMEAIESFLRKNAPQK